jgi:hypothetical protein
LVRKLEQRIDNLHQVRLLSNDSGVDAKIRALQEDKHLLLEEIRVFQSGSSDVRQQATLLARRLEQARSQLQLLEAGLQDESALEQAAAAAEVAYAAARDELAQQVALRRQQARERQELGLALEREEGMALALEEELAQAQRGLDSVLAQRLGDDGIDLEVQMAERWIEAAQAQLSQLEDSLLRDAEGRADEMVS